MGPVPPTLDQRDVSAEVSAAAQEALDEEDVYHSCRPLQRRLLLGAGLRSGSFTLLNF